MYHNPTARAGQSHYHVDPAVLELHCKLSQYGQTPLRSLPPSLCSHLAVKHIFLKDESNRFGLPAFKILGASWASYRAITKQLNLSSKSSLQEVKGTASGSGIKLHAATDGNFGRAVAYMACLLGVAADIYVPKTMVEETKRLIASEGAQVIVVEGDYDAAVRAADGASKNPGGLLVQDDAWSGYEEIPQWVVEGYSTMMLEIDAQMQDAIGTSPDLLVVPVGVGSLAQAVVAHYKSKRPLPFILTVEPETAACLKTSLEVGKPTAVETGDTSMCGMNCGTVSSLAWPILRDGVDASITVSETESEAALNMLSGMGISTGPCSAGTLAALSKACQIGRERLGLKEQSCIVLFGTEGPR